MENGLVHERSGSTGQIKRPRLVLEAQEVQVGQEDLVDHLSKEAAEDPVDRVDQEADPEDSSSINPACLLDLAG